MDLILAGSATAMAAVFTNPIEVVKTRMQIQGELARTTAAQKSSVLYRNPFQGFAHIVRTEGVRGIQKGLVAGMLFQFTMNGTRLGMFEILRQPFARATNNNNNNFIVFARDLALGCSAGALGALVGSPFFLVKCRMQTYSVQNPLGHQHSYANMRAGFRDVIDTEGVRGLFRGAQAAMLRVAVGGGTQISVYTNVKRFLMNFNPQQKWQDGVSLHLASSLITGLAVTVTMNPFDVVSTRLYNQNVVRGSRGGSLYHGPLDCIAKIARHEGLNGFYKGFVAHYLRLGPHTILTFIFWEQLKHLYHGR